MIAAEIRKLWGHGHGSYLISFATSKKLYGRSLLQNRDLFVWFWRSWEPGKVYLFLIGCKQLYGRSLLQNSKWILHSIASERLKKCLDCYTYIPDVNKFDFSNLFVLSHQSLFFLSERLARKMG